MSNDIGSHVGKTKLPELSRSVQSDEPLAQLPPSEKAVREAAVKNLIEFAHQRTPVVRLNIKHLVEEGRLEP